MWELEESWGLEATLPVNENTTEENDNHCLRPSGSRCEALGFLSSALPFEDLSFSEHLQEIKRYGVLTFPCILVLRGGVECDCSFWGDESVLELEVLVAQRYECAKRTELSPFKWLTLCLWIRHTQMAQQSRAPELSLQTIQDSQLIMNLHVQELFVVFFNPLSMGWWIPLCS